MFGTTEITEDTELMNNTNRFLSVPSVISVVI